MADHDGEQTGQPDQTGWQRFLDRLPVRLALAAIGLVWLAGCVWSFEEQTAYARSKRFTIPELLPLVIDGMAIAMAAVAWAASLDARPAVLARIGTALAVACSAASNAAWAWERSAADPGTIALAAGVPVLANVAFEVLLGESRRQVLRRRGLPAPVALPYPRLVRMWLAPWPTYVVWRRLVLEATDPHAAFTAAQQAAHTRPARHTRPADQTRPDRRRPAADHQTGPDRTSAPDRTGPADQTKQPVVARSGPGAPPDRTATVTPIDAARSGPAAVRNAHVLADRYADRLPGQREIQKALGWGAERARAALAELTKLREGA